MLCPHAPAAGPWRQPEAWHTCKKGFLPLTNAQGPSAPLPATPPTMSYYRFRVEHLAKANSALEPAPQSAAATQSWLVVPGSLGLLLPAHPLSTPGGHKK